MIWSDVMIMAVYVVILGSFKTRDSLAVVIAFALTVAYTSSEAWNYHPAWCNHIIQSLILLPFVIFLNRVVCFSFFGYVLLHWLVAGDYIFMPRRELVPANFALVDLVTNLVIAGTLIYDGFTNRGALNLDLGWLPDLVSRAFKHEAPQK